MLTRVVSTTNDTSNQGFAVNSRGLFDASVSGDVSAYTPDRNSLLPVENELAEVETQESSDSGYSSSLNPPDSWFMQFLDPGGDVVTSWDSTSTASIGTLLQVEEVQSTTFPDDYHLAVPELDLLRASFEIATRLQSAERLWDMQAASVFQDPGHSQWACELPKNLQPTKTQLSLAHHPILDIIPWPSVRDKLIRMYNLPPNFWPRHPDDGSECSLIRLVYDMEAGGVRVWGADPASEESWEIEESLFAAWWWALDRKILLATNRRRTGRGQRPLQELSVQCLTNISS